MDDSRCRTFFLNPTATFHRQYEALRAFFVERRRLKEIATQMGYRYSSLRSLVCRFRAQVQGSEGPPFLRNRRVGALLVNAHRPKQFTPTSQRSPIGGSWIWRWAGSCGRA